MDEITSVVKITYDVRYERVCDIEHAWGRQVSTTSDPTGERNVRYLMLGGS